MRLPILLVAFLAIVTTQPPPAAAQATAESKLTDSVLEFSAGKLDPALNLLSEAEGLTASPPLLAKIHRSRGIIYDVQGKRIESILAFMRALYFDADIGLNEKEHQGSVLQVFACARSLVLEGIKEAAVRGRFAEQLSKPDWACPTAVQMLSEPGEARIDEAPADVVSTSAAVEPSGSPTWPLWLGGGVALAATGAGIGLGVATMGAANDGDPNTDPKGTATGATVSFVVAGSAAAATLIYWLLSDSSPEPTAAHPGSAALVRF